MRIPSRILSTTALYGTSLAHIVGPKGAPVVYPAATPEIKLSTASLASARRVFERPNDKQQNLISIAPEAQAHVVLENYTGHAAKRMVAICQHGGNLGGGFWWSSPTVKALQASDPRVVIQDALVGTSVLVAADKPGFFRFPAPILDSVRALRDHANDDFEKKPDAVGKQDARTRRRLEAKAYGIPIADNALRTRLVSADIGRIVFEREGVARDGKGGPLRTHRMVLEALPGTTFEIDEAHNVTAKATDRPQMRVSYLTNEPHLSPYTPLELLKPEVRAILEKDLQTARLGLLGKSETAELNAVTAALEDLSSLIFHEKGLAGGWRFLTYFGRDPMQVVQMLRKLLAPEVVEGLLEAVLERLSEEGEVIPLETGGTRVSTGGEVPHEESICDQGEHERLGHALDNKVDPKSVRLDSISSPIFDYKMVDDDFMLVSLLADYMLDKDIDQTRKDAFLSRINRSGHCNLDQARKAFGYVTRQATPYAQSVQTGRADATKLIKLPDGQLVGDWRDSNLGLDLARFPGSININLVPTTLAKAVDLAPLLGITNPGLAPMAEAWKGSRAHFRVTLSQTQLRERLEWYLNKVRTSDPLCKNDAERAAWVAHFESVELQPGLTVEQFVYKGKALTGDLASGISFSAIGLDETGTTIPVMTTDGYMGLIGAEAQPDAVRELATITRLPAPLGLKMDEGIVITQASLCGNDAQYDRMAPGAYHGQRVVWPWQESEAFTVLHDQHRKLLRAGHPDVAALALETAADIEKVSRAAGMWSTKELYGFKLIDGKPRASALTGGTDEYDAWPGNDPQLWSAVLPILRWANRHGLLD